MKKRRQNTKLYKYYKNTEVYKNSTYVLTIFKSIANMNFQNNGTIGKSI